MTTTGHPRRGRRFLLTACGIALAVALGASACDRGGDTEVSAAPDEAEHDHASDDHATVDHKPKTDPCTLISNAEAETILGPVDRSFEGAPDGGTYGVVPDSRVCRYTLKGDPGLGATVGFADYDAADKFKGMANQMGSMKAGIEGVGDESIWLEPFRTLITLDGKTVVTVQILSEAHEPAPLKEQAVKLTAFALDGLDSA